MDCIGRTYNIYQFCRNRVALDSEYKEHYDNHASYVEDNWKVYIARDKCFNDCLKQYIRIELEKCINELKQRGDKTKIQVDAVDKFKNVIFNISSEKLLKLNPTEHTAMQSLYLGADNGGDVSENEKTEIETLREELYFYKEEFEKNISEDSRYDFLKHVFLCEFENIEMILDNFDKIRPEYIFQHWGNLSFHIITFAKDNEALMEASGKINGFIFDFVKKYGTPILCEKLIENAPQIFNLLCK